MNNSSINIINTRKIDGLIFATNCPIEIFQYGRSFPEVNGDMS